MPIISTPLMEKEALIKDDMRNYILINFEF